jgi:acetylornithine deacetylase/succinyl-diaminopimelate desuccinylase-like protein
MLPNALPQPDQHQVPHLSRRAPGNRAGQARGTRGRSGGESDDARIESDSRPPPLTPKILAPVQKLAAQFWPGLPVLLQGASDGRYLSAAGIPTYGISGLFLGPDFGNVHGRNEYVSVQTIMETSYTAW